MRKGVPIVAFVGPSAAGKTALLERVVRVLEGRAVCVGVVKHSSHRVCPDQPGKDSARLYAAGAEAVVLAAPNQIASFVRRETPPPLMDALLALPPGLDIVLVEGFARESVSRVVVLPSSAETWPRFAQRGPILRTVIARSTEDGKGPDFPPGLVEELAGELATLAGHAPMIAPRDIAAS